MFIKLVVLVMVFCSFTSGVLARPLYLEALKGEPDAKQLAKSREKILEYQQIEIRDDLDQKLPPFHRRPEQKITQGETFCQICHLPVPHRHSPWTRALLNMHSRYIACSTCHFRPENVTFTYRWLNFSSGQTLDADPNRFRTGRDLDNEIPLDGTVKIASFYQDEPAVPLPGSAVAEAVAREWRDGDTQQKTRLHARLHRPLEPKGLSCERCHQEEKPLLDLRALGAQPAQVEQIQRHVLPQFFSRYREKEQKIRILDLTR